MCDSSSCCHPSSAGSSEPEGNRGSCKCVLCSSFTPVPWEVPAPAVAASSHPWAPFSNKEVTSSHCTTSPQRGHSSACLQQNLRLPCEIYSPLQIFIWLANGFKGSWVMREALTNTITQSCLVFIKNYVKKNKQINRDSNFSLVFMPSTDCTHTFFRLVT